MNNEEKSFSKTSINWYPGHMAKTKRLISENINLIDIVYELIDARMPYSSKIKDIDSLLKNKPRVLVVTKLDLCDKKETDKWLKYYEEKGYHVVALDLEHGNVKPLLAKTNELMKEINSKRAEKGLKPRKGRALIVGIPNVGKSTLINRLVGKKATTTGNKPGVTKSLSWIRIGKDLELLDTPGILWPKFDDENVAYNLASLTAIKEEVLPIEYVVYYILKTLNKYYPNILLERYGVDELNEDIVETLDIIGKKRGCLERGGLVDYDKVYTIIMNDIKMGIVKGITFDRVDNYGL
jgi:ribosome biogenesis GTPase A